MQRRLTDGLDDERATSPTIGAVLLVGITVALATTAGAGVINFADETKRGAFATATVDHVPTEDRVTVTWAANANAEKLRVIVRVGDQRRTVSLSAVGDSAVVDGDGTTVSKGEVTRWDDPSVEDDDRVSVTVLAVAGGETTVVAERSVTV